MRPRLTWYVNTGCAEAGEEEDILVKVEGEDDREKTSG